MLCLLLPFFLSREKPELGDYAYLYGIKLIGVFFFIYVDYIGCGDYDNEGDMYVRMRTMMRRRSRRRSSSGDFEIVIVIMEVKLNMNIKVKVM